jgi:hypothetical protein
LVERAITRSEPGTTLKAGLTLMKEKTQMVKILLVKRNRIQEMKEQRMKITRLPVMKKITLKRGKSNSSTN